MPLALEDYALIGDLQTAALVGRDGSIDWLCLPDFSSPACFAAILGTSKNGRWQIAPTAAIKKTTRSYREGTLVLDTIFETHSGAVRVTDFAAKCRCNPNSSSASTTAAPSPGSPA
jgi:GH15 family glucan-1,4-alpha-glucosidase